MINRDEIISVVVMESVAEPVKPKDVKVVRENDMFYVRFKTILQTLNLLNRNRRIYTNNAIEPGLNAEHLLELMAKRSWFGEAGHPLSNDTARILTIDPKLISHMIYDTSVRGDIVSGTIETLDNGGYGNQFTRLILQNMEPAFSLRALASLTKKADGTSIVGNRAHIVTYDWVILPSHKEAYRDQTSPIEKVTKSIASVGNTVKESMIPITESMIRDFISLESVNVNIVSNVCEVLKESMELTPDMKKVILREGGNTYHVKLEDKVRHDVMNFMSKL